MVSRVCFQIIGADVTISMACEACELALNMAEPIIAFNLFFGLTLLRNAAIAKEARATGASIYSLVLEKSWLSKEQLDDLLTPEKMTRPR